MFNISTAVKYTSILSIMVIFYLGFWYVSTLKSQLVSSQHNVTQLKNSLKSQEQTILQIQKEQQQIKNINSILSARNIAHSNEIEELKKKFETKSNGESRNFSAITAAKPNLIERAINEGSREAVRCVEIATGSPLTEAEKNATSPNTINKQCPSLANPSYKPNMP